MKVAFLRKLQVLNFRTRLYLKKEMKLVSILCSPNYLFIFFFLKHSLSNILKVHVNQTAESEQDIGISLLGGWEMRTGKREEIKLAAALFFC